MGGNGLRGRPDLSIERIMIIMPVSARIKRPIALLTLLSLLASGLVFSPAGIAQEEPTAEPIAQAEAVSQDDGEFTLTVLHNNDGESKLLPNEDGGFPGIARFVTHLKSLQEEADDRGGVITLTSGDNFLASQVLEISRNRSGALYDSIALSGLYDAMALGNHDFDIGPEFTARFISGFNPPVHFLSANMDFSGEPELQELVDDGVLGAYTTIETDGEMIGVIGAVTQQLPNISSPRNATVSPVLAAVNDAAEALTDDGVNKIILISHLQGVDEERDLISDLSNVDIVIAGGGDDLLANEGDTCMPDEEPVNPYPIWERDADRQRVPVITAPGGYRCIGELTATFDSDGNLTGATGRSIGVDFDVTPDRRVQSRVVDPLSEAVEEITQDIIGTSEVDLDGRRAHVRTVSTNEGNLLADALRHRATALAEDFGTPVPHVALQNGGGIRNDAVIPAGDISTGDTWDIAPFSNFLVVGTIPRRVFRRMLEQALDRLPDAGGQFPQISGFTITYDPDAPAREINRDGNCELVGEQGSRIQDVVLDDGTKIVSNGRVQKGSEEITIATIDFLANGGDCYPLGKYDFTRLGVSYQQALSDYIRFDLDGEVTAKQYPEDGEGRISVHRETYRVTKGDTLSKIAKEHLGAEYLWPRIFRLNEGVVQADGRSLTNPDLIHIGWELEIPS